jgi:hypothetical protein
MRLCHRAGHAVPLLTLFAMLAGCATSTVPQPPNFTQNPQVVAIYAVDSAFQVLPDVLIYSNLPGDAGKVSPRPPPSYGGYRVEFDQPVNGETVANNANRGASVGTNISFCSPLDKTPVQLFDLAAGARAPITSSICYDATSPLGSHPHILIIPGDTTGSTPALTCSTFTPNQGAGPGGNVLAPNHPYGIQVKSDIQNASNKPLQAPTDAGWVGDTYTFTTSGLKILAAGFIDANTGFFIWLDKSDPGFEKDLAPCATTSTCPPPSDNPHGSTFLQPIDGSPFLVVLSEPVTAAGKAGDNDLTGVVTLNRADNSVNKVPEFFAQTASDLLADPRVIEVYLGTGDVKNGNTPTPFEPGTQFSLTIPGTIASDAGGTDTLGADKTYTFGTAPGSPENVGIVPSSGAQAQSFTGTSPEIDFSVPIATTAATTFSLKDPAQKDVPLAPPPDGVVISANRQIVTLTPAAPLLPETTYTISYTGVTAAPDLKPGLANAPIPNASAQFTTATFRLNRISPTPTSATNIDRQTTVDPVAVLKNGNLTAVFNNGTAPTGVDANSVSVSELNGTAATKLGTTVTPVAGKATSFQIGVPGYQPKYGQKYEVRAATSITDPTSGKTLKAEGCTTGDCSDVKTFTTRKVGVTIAANPDATTPTGFRVNFTDPIDPASLTPFLTTRTTPGEFKLFQRDASGAIQLDGAGNPVQIPIDCAITSPTRVICTAAAPLGNSTQSQLNSFVASAVFLPTATTDPKAGGPSGPAVVAASTSTDPSARFSGNASSNVFAPCGP